MPEGPEVRRNAQQLKTALQWKKIKSVEVIGGRYLRKPITDLDTLPGCNIEDVGSKGKLIYIELEDKRYIHSTLGMAGHWSLMPVKHTRFSFQLAQSTSTGPHFSDPRNFGTFKIVNQDEHIAKLDSLGHDFSQGWNGPIESVIGRVEERLKRYGKKQTIAEALLDQRIFCGIGNYLRADALWLARLNPHTAASKLSAKMLESVCRSCLTVSQAAWNDDSPIGALGVPYHHLTYYQRQTPFGGEVIAEDLGGRTIWWCPTEQTEFVK